MAETIPDIDTKRRKSVLCGRTWCTPCRPKKVEIRAALAVIKRRNSPVQYRKYEKNMLPKHNQGAQMHSMHGRQNFKAYWNFSLTFPEVLVLSFSTPTSPLSATRPHAVSMRGDVPPTLLHDVPCTYMFLPRVSASLPSAFLRFISTCGHLRIEYGRILPREREMPRLVPLYEAF